jgi:hypothetical protein
MWLINFLIKALKIDRKQLSDGYHTFQDLYDHRIELWITICHLNRDRAWKSKLHSDGTMFNDSFILGLNRRKGKQITYHLNLKDWDRVDVPELKNAPVWDGHTPEDVVNRLEKWNKR